MAASPASAWYASLPPLTKLYGTACFATTALLSAGLLEVAPLPLLWPLVLRGQLWRLLTTFIFLGQFSMSFCVNMLWMCAGCAPPAFPPDPRRSFRYGVQLESQTYAGKGGDYLYCLLVLAAACLASTALLPGVILSSSLILALVYVWSRANQTARVSFFGLFQVEGFYLPFACLGFTVLTGNDPTPDLRGILAGHLYYFLHTAWPRQGGPQLLATPAWVSALVQWAYGGYGYVNPNYVRPAAPAAGFQGRGRRLNE